jgi:hypothetical protein
MNDAEVLKRLLEEARREVENWPESMKSQEPGSLRLSWRQVSSQEDDEYEQPIAKCG